MSMKERKPLQKSLQLKNVEENPNQQRAMTQKLPQIKKK